VREDHYGGRYLSRERWISYVAQLSSVADLRPKSIAPLAGGPGVMGARLEAPSPGRQYVSVDIDPDLKPKVRGSVTALPLADGAIDAVFCCQVLEHLPYEMFVPALLELIRVAKHRVVVSLPDVTPFFYLRFRGSRYIFPYLWKGFSFPHPFPKTHDFAVHGQHFWEIGKRGYPARRVLADMGLPGVVLRDHFRLIERPYWHFFLLDKPL